VDVPNAYADLSPDSRSVLLRLRGAADPGPERTWESFVVTEDDHIDYPGAGELEGAIPVTLAARLRRSHFLFLGYDLADWNLRLVVSRLRGGRSAPYASWAVRAGPTPLELAFWRHLDVQVLDIDEDAVCRPLEGRLTGGVDVSCRTAAVAAHGARPVRGHAARRDAVSSAGSATRDPGRERRASRLDVLYGPRRAGKSSPIAARPEPVRVARAARWLSPSSRRPDDPALRWHVPSRTRRSRAPRRVGHGRAGVRSARSGLPAARSGGGVLCTTGRPALERAIAEVLGRAPERTCCYRYARTRRARPF
jgi:hypothetical protein